MRERDVVDEPTLPVYGVAEYLTASPYRQMQVLADYKYPQRGVPRANYYREARDTIRQFHKSGEDRGVVTSAVTSLRNRLRLALKEREVVRTRHNIRVLESYLRYRADRHYEVRRVAHSTMMIGEVRVKANPDLFVIEAETPKLVKFDFAERPPSDRFAGIVAECLYRGAREAKIDVQPSDVLVCSIEADREWHAKPSVQRWRNVIAACRQIALLWPSVAPD